MFNNMGGMMPPMGMPTGMSEFGAGPTGGMISGKWINKRTGETINVRDSIIDGNNMIVISDRGQIDFNIFSRDYIQACDDNIYDYKGNVVGTEKLSTAEIIGEQPAVPVKQENDDDFNVLTMPLDARGKTTVKHTNKEHTEQKHGNQLSKQKPENEEFKMIDKIFSKINSNPQISITINWADFPAKELNMLKSFFDVSDEEICKYIYNKYVDEEVVKDAINDLLRN